MDLSKLSKKDLKKVCYVNFGGNLKDGYVEYIIQDNNCIFTGITISGSTINYAREIIDAICKKEGINDKNFTFFDLQTHKGYQGKRPGEFEYSILEFSDSKMTWDNITCLDWIKLLFSDHIGPNAYEQKKSD